ncbi:MAG TPA: hypothetical protein VFX12_06055 [Vicinamibacterales bacterium]|nr:hypothetical protein [Vicinamibacterales bacterium]
MEISEVRRRVRATVEQARRQAAERRTRGDDAAREYGQFLERVAVPIVHQLAIALNAEGHRFTVQTPEDRVRLLSERSGDDYVELVLDSQRDEPAVVVRASRGRGRRMLTSERDLQPGKPIAELTEDDVVDGVLADALPLIER